MSDNDWVVLRSEPDSTQDFLHPTGWIDSLKGFKVDPNLGEHGGILVNDEARAKYIEDYAFRDGKADPGMTRADVVEKPPPTKQTIAKWLAAQRINGWFAMPLRGILTPDADVAEAPTDPGPVAFNAPPPAGKQNADRSLEDTLDARIEAIKAAGGPSLGPGRPTLAKKRAYIQANEHIA